MEVLYEVRGENLLIYLPEELDHHNAKTITEQSDWYIVSNQIKNIIFNFKRTMFMDSSGIGVIMGRYKLVKKRGGSITVTNINNSIDRIFTISGLYKIVSKTETPSLVKWLDQSPSKKKQLQFLPDFRFRTLHQTPKSYCFPYFYFPCVPPITISPS